MGETILRTKRLSVYLGKVARGDNGSNPPWRGYCWGSDWPRVNLQRGTYCTCIDLSWLCYFVSVYWNRPTPQEVPDGGR